MTFIELSGHDGRHVLFCTLSDHSFFIILNFEYIYQNWHTTMHAACWVCGCRPSSHWFHEQNNNEFSWNLSVLYNENTAILRCSKHFGKKFNITCYLSGLSYQSASCHTHGSLLHGLVPTVHKWYITTFTWTPKPHAKPKLGGLVAPIARPIHHVEQSEDDESVGSNDKNLKRLTFTIPWKGIIYYTFCFFCWKSWVMWSAISSYLIWQTWSIFYTFLLVKIVIYLYTFCVMADVSSISFLTMLIKVQ